MFYVRVANTTMLIEEDYIISKCHKYLRQIRKITVKKRNIVFTNEYSVKRYGNITQLKDPGKLFNRWLLKKDSAP
jgi:hypothetical protein